MLQTQDIPLVPLQETPQSEGSIWSALEGLSIDDALTNIANGIVGFAFRLLIAILVFYIGRFVITKLYKMVKTIMISRKIDPSLTSFVLSFTRMVLYFILLITIIGILGLETSSFLAIFASAGVAIGMALSGTLQNFAGGVLILLLKPYKVGDYIETQGYAGTVKAIQIFHTIINTPDNKSIILPNGGLSTGSINNYSMEDYRRVDWTISLSYDTNLMLAKESILDILMQDNRVVKQYIEDDMELRRTLNLSHEETDDHPSVDESTQQEQSSVKESQWRRFFHLRKKKAEIVHTIIKEKVGIIAPEKTDRSPFVALGEMAESSINITVRAWTHSSNYWSLFFAMNERFFTLLPEKGFSFPFPQMDVHLDQSITK